MSLTGMFRQVTITAQLLRELPSCRECGCKCSLCQNNSLDWHHQIEELKAKLVEANTRAAHSEHEHIESRDRVEQELVRVHEELFKQRDRYDRLYESHKKLQKNNNDLEEKLLNVVSKLNEENQDLKESLSSMQCKLTELESTVQYLEDECERLKNDCILAVQLLQCQPSQFVSYKLSELPITLKDRVRNQLSPKELLELEEDDDTADAAARSVRIPIATFPPTAVSFLRTVNKMGAAAGDEGPIRRNNTVPVDLVARALLPASSLDDTSLSRRRRGDAYVCSNCRRCDSALDGASSAATHRTANRVDRVDSPDDGSATSGHPAANNAGVHAPRKFSAQAIFQIPYS